VSVVLSPSIFGPIITGGDIEDWTLALLKRWYSTYLAEVERQHAMSGHDLPRPLAYAIGTSFDKWPEDQVPAVIVATRGTFDRPTRDGGGIYNARWAVDVGVVCSASTQAQSHRLAQLYTGAARDLILQRPSLDGQLWGGIIWTGEDYTGLAYDDTRSLYSGSVQVAIQANAVAVANAGPTTPDAPLSPDDTVPWQDWPTVKEGEVGIEIDIEEPGSVTQPSNAREEK
jgi:hypothetical protein